MRPFVVVMRNILLDQVIQMTTPEGHEVVQAFTLDRPNPALGEGVQLW